jgi:hypothetical protein
LTFLFVFEMPESNTSLPADPATTTEAPNTAAAQTAQAAQAKPSDGLKDGQDDIAQSVRHRLQRAGDSYMSVPPTGSILTGKQEHCKLLKCLNSKLFS